MLIKIYIGTRICASVLSSNIFCLSSSPVIMQQLLSISYFLCSSHKRLIPSPDIIYSSCVVHINILSCPRYMSEMWSMIQERLHSDMTVMCLHFNIDWCIIHPLMGVVKSIFFWCGFVFGARSAHKITKYNYFSVLWHFWNSLTFNSFTSLHSLNS